MKTHHRLSIKLATILLLLNSQLTAFQNQEDKYSIAVIPFTVQGSVDGDPANRLAAQLGYALEASGLFKAKVQNEVKPTLYRHSIIPTNCADLDCALQAAQVLDVQLILNGSIKKIGPVFLLDLQLVHAESGRVIRQIKDEYKGTIQGLYDYMPVIAQMIVDSEPATSTSQSRTRKKGKSIVNLKPSMADFNGDAGNPILIHKKKSRKWKIYGLALASGVGAGVYLATKNSGSNPNSAANQGELPGSPSFPNR